MYKEKIREYSHNYHTMIPTLVNDFCNVPIVKEVMEKDYFV